MPFINLTVSGLSDPTLAKALAQGVTERTTRILRKAFPVIAVTVSFISPVMWTIGGQSLEEHALASFWLDIKITAGTNTSEEKAAYLADIFSFMREQLGPLHEASYALLHEVPANAWGFDGVSQEQRHRSSTLGVLGS